MKFYSCYRYAHLKIGKLIVHIHGQPGILKSLLPVKQLVMRINLTAFIIGIAILNVSASVNAQRITLNVKDAPLKIVFEKIKKQTGYFLWYDDELLENTKTVTLNLKDASINEALDACFHNQPLSYVITNKTIVVKAKEKNLKGSINELLQKLNISGKVSDEIGLPLPGASLKIKGTAISTTTGNNGSFTISNAPENSILIVSFLSFETREIPATTDMVVTLTRSTSKLDEIQIMAYGTTTQRLSTSSIGKVSATEIEKQPVSNPLLTLQGRIPGVVVTQSSGLPGAGVDIQIRGRSSLENTSTPLYLIDGVPFNAGSLDKIGSGIITVQSPFSSINPQDIESIEILKDADATAIYGSRGANGVVLITTKRGKAGKTQVSVNIYSGSSVVTRKMKYLGTDQYLEMRREAFKNDGISPTVANAPDLLVWDNSRYTDWQDLMIGGTAKTTDVQVNLQGGSETTQFFIGSNYRRETTVFPGDMADTKGNVRFNLNHRAAGNKFMASFSASYNNDKNRLISTDLSSVVNMVPNAPYPYDAEGKLVWSEAGVFFNNPLAYTLQPYEAITDNIVSSLNLQYEIIPGLRIRANGGYTTTMLKQSLLRPKSSINPSTTTNSSANYGNNTARTWIIEPQAEYDLKTSKGKLNILIGASLQQDLTSGTKLVATNFSSDALLESPSAAGTLSSSVNYAKYRYQAVFARANYNYANRYILNVTGRGDGSSRFGPGKRYGNFGAVGAGWVISEEAWVKNKVPGLSFAKLRGSYGITGNDKIGDYRYLDTWYSTSNPYQGVSGLIPLTLNNTNFAWEVNNKLEMAIELGFINDRILLNAGYFRNRSSSQLAEYNLPAQTGFNSILRNLPAKVQNLGWELALNATNIKTEKLLWTTSINLTIARNKLLSFPGLETSTYANTYIIGQPLDISKDLLFLGVDPQTGIYQFNSTNIVSDRTSINNLTPKFFGGFQNTISFRSIELGFLFQFTKQRGRNYISASSPAEGPGTMSNQPIYTLNRWRQPGDNVPVQRYTTALSGTVGSAITNYTYYSDARFSDRSFIRLKTASLSYNVSEKWLSVFGISKARIYVQGQNLLTITNYKGNDPETFSSAYLPPLRTLTAGIQLTL